MTYYSLEFLVMPSNLKMEIFCSPYDEHSAGHLGFTKPYYKIRNRFYWVGISKDVECYVKGCANCQARKGKTNMRLQGLLQPILISLPFDYICTDFLGSYCRSRNGNTMIIVATGYATCWAETRILPTGKAGPVAKFLLESVMG
ncbi:hypothetical protein ILUMI_17001 [Ignelater luminosus]|uniref:Integrase zinc-binding domain-containing protein n=1 Tax=Ignelater luminosus TaxID=2038154 RepID=A0A8K0CPX3_IGNLU|nr:hypothetical protein ILUMI_17001 [Ignelater luminosus]